MQTWYQNVQGNYNFSLTQTNEDTAQQYVDTYREAMTAMVKRLLQNRCIM